MLLGAPTSMALAKVCTESRGWYVPLERKSGMVLFSFTERTILSMGAPIVRAQNAAQLLPTFPLGIMMVGFFPNAWL